MVILLTHVSTEHNGHTFDTCLTHVSAGTMVIQDGLEGVLNEDIMIALDPPQHDQKNYVNLFQSLVDEPKTNL